MIFRAASLSKPVSMPATGDLEAGETLPLYHEVGHVLKGLIAKSGEFYFIVLVVNEEAHCKLDAPI